MGEVLNVEEEEGLIQEEVSTLMPQAIEEAHSNLLANSKVMVDISKVDRVTTVGSLGTLREHAVTSRRTGRINKTGTLVTEEISFTVSNRLSVLLLDGM